MAKPKSAQPFRSNPSRSSSGYCLPTPDREPPMNGYRPRRSRCLLCEKTFESYDPRYNRRCPSCQLRVAHSTAFYVDEEYSAFL